MIETIVRGYLNKFANNVFKYIIINGFIFLLEGVIIREDLRLFIILANNHNSLK